MKTLFFVLSLISLNAFSLEMPQAKALGAKAMEKGQEIASACKNEQMIYCKAYTKMPELKECLTKNKEKLSPTCKTSAGL